jgi:hypothetical protein
LVDFFSTLPSSFRPAPVLAQEEENMLEQPMRIPAELVEPFNKPRISVTTYSGPLGNLRTIR